MFITPKENAEPKYHNMGDGKETWTKAEEMNRARNRSRILTQIRDILSKHGILGLVVEGDTSVQVLINQDGEERSITFDGRPVFKGRPLDEIYELWSWEFKQLEEWVATIKEEVRA